MAFDWNRQEIPVRPKGEDDGDGVQAVPFIPTLEMIVGGGG